MRMLFIYCASGNVDHVRDLIDVHEVHAFVAAPIEAASSASADRPSQGARASALVITAVPEHKTGELLEALTAYSRIHPPEEKFRVFELPVERLL